MPSEKTIKREERIQAAITFLDENPETPLNTCARRFEVDRNTLRRRKDGQKTHHSGGQNKILTGSQKEALLKYIRAQAYAGFPVTANMIFAVIVSWRVQAGCSPPSSRWMKLFLQENRKEFHIIRMKPMDSKRIVAQNPAVSNIAFINIIILIYK